MLQNKKTETKPVTTQLETDDSAKVVAQARGFWDKYSKPILYFFGGLAAILAAYIGYTKFYATPREQKAIDAIWHAQDYYMQDSLKLALEGDGQFPGFEKIAKTYSGTKAGNLAKFYAGTSALRLGDFKKAESFLKDFNTDSRTIQAVAYGRLADAYAEQGKKAEAVSMYNKAGTYFPEHIALSSENLFRAGLLSETMGKNEDAVKYYKMVKEKYSKTEKGYQIDKFLARLGVIE